MTADEHTARSHSHRSMGTTASLAGRVAIVALCTVGGATTAEAHGEQVLFILGADLAVLVGASLVALFWHVPWKGRVLFLVACVGGVIATYVIPWFPNTVGASAPYGALALVLFFGTPPVILGSIVYFSVARWYNMRERERGA